MRRRLFYAFLLIGLLTVISVGITAIMILDLSNKERTELIDDGLLRTTKSREIIIITSSYIPPLISMILTDILILDKKRGDGVIQ